MYGAKVSRKGFDVSTASDKQLALSSEWPLLPIEAEGTFNVVAGETYNEVIYTHNLGYIPVFMYWQEIGGKRYVVGREFFLNIYTTTTTIHLNDTIIRDTATIHWKVFRRPLLLNYDAGNIISTDASKKDSGDYGLLVSLPEKGVSSTQKRDFGVRSDTRQLMIHKTGYFGVGTGGSTITHNLGYQPMYWFFIENSYQNPTGAYSLQYQADDFVVSATTTALYWQFYGDPSAIATAYLIFKDPINQVG